MADKTTVLSQQAAICYDVEKVRAEFPILQEKIHGKPLIYLDNANTTQKPLRVLEAIQRFYSQQNANIHRATHLLSERATVAYDDAREKVRRFLNARYFEEIVFVRNATEGVNLIAQTFGRRFVGEGDEILISAMEHHANIVPWQMLCEEKGAKLRVIPISAEGELVLEEAEKLIGPRTKLVGIVHMSNVIGTINPVEELIRMAHAKGVPVLVDGAQSAYHMPIDVQEMDCDFFVFSGHKLYGPTGIGVLYAKREILETLPPWMGGGDMILSVTFEKTIYNEIPYRFEAGTPHIAGAVGLGAAIDFLDELGLDNIAVYEAQLTEYTARRLEEVPKLKRIGKPERFATVFSFMLGDIHPHDVGTFLDRDGIAVRTGQHCAHPLLQCFGVPATVRVSLACYNTKEEIDALVESLKRTVEVFG
ncbi:cysteine desulfurase; L-selenocysteine selenide-lyase (L-alanine-forming) [Chthonomonas calidirosea]|uniref:Cysteine desulfurase n=1 Tax=Chthonomonas calidirosea (strain DSM 23976 / ICMP 18418 / T49) TaxID=1303518 RepID=S0EVN9_CHTCT|nr:cysteine desulfurase [Chthonomonas calidirosea]CCW34432.1 cysteine desulfurase/L-selenocysteine selenide-lyase (L-alanine-forming) [Chthonomonas calidirosea T49]CEK14789.1 cysteine desulfurase; L-selenocysteine selenide-lyase (L-alanine-forming) [Chthonomonas calidirosea]